MDGFQEQSSTSFKDFAHQLYAPESLDKREMAQAVTEATKHMFKTSSIFAAERAMSPQHTMGRADLNRNGNTRTMFDEGAVLATIAEKASLNDLLISLGKHAPKRKHAPNMPSYRQLDDTGLYLLLKFADLHAISTDESFTPLPEDLGHLRRFVKATQHVSNETADYDMSMPGLGEAAYRWILGERSASITIQ